MRGRRLAMWSGPRHISTALMRSWENRPDTEVIDEPLYAHYLQYTGLEHPLREEILGAMESDWRRVAAQLTAEVAQDRILYQKHMTHHLTPDVGLDWIDELDNCFLIRDPRQVVRSYSAKREALGPEELGYHQQHRLFERIRARTGRTPPVIDIEEVLQHPRPILEELCRRLELPFREEMLRWPAGRRASDGVWASHWYEAVERTTGFSPTTAKRDALSSDQEAIAEACSPFYEELSAYRIH